MFPKRVLKLRRRLSEMSGHEIFVRALQEFRKRYDAISYRLRGVSHFARLDRNAVKPSAFYFDPDAVPAILKLLHCHLPQEVANTIRRADAICERRFDLLGYEQISFGDDIDWHFDPVNDVRTPLKPWYLLEKADITPGDRKVIWELNRHQHFVTLAKAFLLTKDEKYLSELMGQWRSWQAANRYPLGINWSSALEVAFRGLSWLWVDMLLRQQPGVPTDWIDELRAAQSQNIRHISRYLSTYSGPNTHLLGELVALFLICSCYPTLPGANDWIGKSLKAIEKQGEDQVQRDGFHFEQSTHYHVYALDFFLHFMLLARRHNVKLRSATELTVEKMLHALGQISQSTVPFRIGDDDGGRVFNPLRNRNTDLLDPLVTGSAHFARGDWKALTTGLTEECLWLLGPKGCEDYLALCAEQSGPRSTALTDCGVYLMTDGSAGRWQLGIDAGPQGTGNSGHGHADALSVQLSSEDGEWLIDPGTFSYSDIVERNRFRGTEAHNTIEVGGFSQADPVHAFAWSSLPTTDVDRWTTGYEWDYFRAHHDGYERLENPVMHSRRVVRIGKIWAVFDDVQGVLPSPGLSLRWHLAPDMELEALAENSFRAVNRSAASLTLTLARSKHQIVSIDDSWTSPQYGKKLASRIIRCTATEASSQQFLTVLSPDAAELEVVSVECEGAHAYDVTCDGSSIRLIFADGKTTWSCGESIGNQEFAFLSGSSPGCLSMAGSIS